MFGTHFYNEGLRKLTIAFGQLFNNIVLQNTSSTGAITKRIRVPLAYAPKEKFIVRLEQQANLQSEFLISLTDSSLLNLKASQSRISQEKLFFLTLEAKSKAHVGGSIAE